MAFDKELLFQSRLPETDIEVEDFNTVRVQGLSRADVLSMQGTKGEGGTAGFERRMLALALVDPELTEAEVGQWQEASIPTELESVVDKVTELSGMNKGAAKEAYLDFEQDPSAEFRVLPGGEVEHEGGPATG